MFCSQHSIDHTADPHVLKLTRERLEEVPHLYWAFLLAHSICCAGVEAIVLVCILHLLVPAEAARKGGREGPASVTIAIRRSACFSPAQDTDKIDTLTHSSEEAFPICRDLRKPLEALTSPSPRQWGWAAWPAGASHGRQ